MGQKAHDERILVPRPVKRETEQVVIREGIAQNQASRSPGSHRKAVTSDFQAPALSPCNRKGPAGLALVHICCEALGREVGKVEIEAEGRELLPVEEKLVLVPDVAVEVLARPGFPRGLKRRGLRLRGEEIIRHAVEPVREIRIRVGIGRSRSLQAERHSENLIHFQAGLFLHRIQDDVVELRRSIPGYPRKIDGSLVRRPRSCRGRQGLALEDVEGINRTVDIALKRDDLQSVSGENDGRNEKYQ